MKYNTYIESNYTKTTGITSEADILSINYSNAFNTFVGNSISIAEKQETQKFKQFLILKDKWCRETIFCSSATDIISNSTYKKIINFGIEALPWIIRDLKRTNNHWFFALEKITGINPIKNKHLGQIELMKNDWVEWAVKNEI